VIKLFNIKKRIEVGELIEHQGTITCLCFFENQYLLSGSEDGKVIIWRCKTWTPIHTLTAKKTYPVIDMSMHPTGRMALVIYKEKILKLWDLTEGKSVHTRVLKYQPEKV